MAKEHFLSSSALKLEDEQLGDRVLFHVKKQAIAYISIVGASSYHAKPALYLQICICNCICFYRYLHFNFCLHLHF